MCLYLGQLACGLATLREMKSHQGGTNDPRTGLTPDHYLEGLIPSFSTSLNVWAPHARIHTSPELRRCAKGEQITKVKYNTHLFTLHVDLPVSWSQPFSKGCSDFHHDISPSKVGDLGDKNGCTPLLSHDQLIQSQYVVVKSKCPTRAVYTGCYLSRAKYSPYPFPLFRPSEGYTRVAHTGCYLRSAKYPPYPLTIHQVSTGNYPISAAFPHYQLTMPPLSNGPTGVVYTGCYPQSGQFPPHLPSVVPGHAWLCM